MIDAQVWDLCFILLSSVLGLGEQRKNLKIAY